MVDDRAMLRVIDDIHGNELGAEGQHIQLGSKGLVLLKHLNGGGGGERKYMIGTHKTQLPMHNNYYSPNVLSHQ